MDNIGKGRKDIGKGQGKGKGKGTENVPKKKGKKTVGEGQQVGMGDRAKFMIRLLNVRGLTDGKYGELELKYLREGKEYNILCLTETQQKIEKVKIADGLYNHTMMRETNDKGGGGLQVIGREDRRVDWKEVKGGRCKDIMILEGKCFGMSIRLILAYFDVGKKKTGDDAGRNRKIRAEIEKAMEENTSEGLMVLGDFNAHLKRLDGRRTDENGKMVLEWIDKLNLILLNGDEKCKGTYTRVEGNTKTAIDMVMVNKKMYEACEEMIIDEDKEEIKFSDHNLVTIKIGLRGRGGVNFGKDKEVMVEHYYKKDSESLRQLREELETTWDIGLSYETLWGKLEKAQDKILKKERRRRVGEKEGVRIVESAWMTEAIREGIKRRRELSRNARNSGGREKEEWEREWRLQKIRVQGMVKESKEAWESQQAKEIWTCGNRGKKLWKHINKLRGKDKGEEDIDFYENGKKLEFEEAWNGFMENWVGIYQMREDNVEDVWGGLVGRIKK